MSPSNGTRRGQIRRIRDETQAPREIVHDVDHRWLRAYTAAVGDLRPRFFAMQQGTDLVAHPVFPVCLEWPLFTQGAAGLEMDELTLNRGLHVGHRVQWHHPIKPGDRLTTTARLLTAQQKKQHVHVRLGLNTVGTADRPVVSTVMDVLYHDTVLVGEPMKLQSEFNKVTTEPSQLTANMQISRFEVDRTNAIIYTECARISNPIHTDDPAAKAAGLPAPVLHGSETLARAVSAVLDYLDPRGEPDILTVSCRFTGMVFSPSTLEVRVSDYLQQPRSGTLAFQVNGSDGSPVISDGLIEFRDMAER